MYVVTRVVKKIIRFAIFCVNQMQSQLKLSPCKLISYLSMLLNFNRQAVNIKYDVLHMSINDFTNLGFLLHCLGNLGNLEKPGVQIMGQCYKSKHKETKEELIEIQH